MDSHQEDENRRTAERHRQRQLDNKAEDDMMEYEMAVEQFISDNWLNLDRFHDFVFTKVDKFVFVPPRVQLYLKTAEAKDQLHTNDMFTPRTFAWMLLEFEDLKILWSSYLRKEFHND